MRFLYFIFTFFLCSGAVAETREIIVRLSEGAVINQSLTPFFFEHQQQKVGSPNITISPEQSHPEQNVYVYKVSPGMSVQEAILQLQAKAGIRSVGLNQKLQLKPIRAAAIQTLTDLVLKESLREEEQYFRKVRWIHAPGHYQRLKPPIVAVIDSGVNNEHPLFVHSAAHWVNKGEIPDNDIDDDLNGYVDDVRGYNFLNKLADSQDLDKGMGAGHGTAVASALLKVDQHLDWANLQNSSKFQIMSLRVLGVENRGGETQSDLPTPIGGLAQAVSAIRYAVDNGADVINLSWTVPQSSIELEQAIQYASDKGVLVVAAAGNNSGLISDNFRVYPVLYKSSQMVTVGAIDKVGHLSSFSNYGTEAVEVASYGDRLVVAAANSNKYQKDSGTSFSAPLVSALAALMLVENNGLTAAELKAKIIEHASGKEVLLDKVMYGAVNFHQTINDIRPTSERTLDKLPEEEPEKDTDETETKDEKSKGVLRSQNLENTTGCGLVATYRGPKPQGPFAFFILAPFCFLLLWRLFFHRLAL